MTSKRVLHFHTDSLPEEVWLRIFSYLRPVDILQARLVCKHWAYLSTQPRIRKKFVLQLTSSCELKKFLVENPSNYLPISYLNIVNQNDSFELEFILKKLGPSLQGIQLTNSIVFKTLHRVNLEHIRELHFNFYETSPDLLQETELEFIRNYTRLSSLNVIFPDDLRFFGISILRKILEMDEIPPLQCISTNYHCEIDEIFLKLMKRHANTLKELEIYFDIQPYDWYPNTTFEVLWQLEKLESLKVSGGCKIDLISAIFENLPKCAPLCRLELDGITTLTDDLLILIINKWTYSIKKLSIFFNGRITGKGAAEIWKLHKSLESLQIGFCYSLGMKEVVSAIAYNTNSTLRQLYACSMDCVNEEDLCRLPQNLPHLEVLDLSGNAKSLTNKALTYIFRYQTRLRKVFLDDSYGFNDIGIAGLGIPEWSNSYPITRLCDLETLSLQNCPKLTDHFIDYLSFPVLRSLKLSKLRHISAAGFRKVVDNCPMLEVLHLAYCDGLNDETLYYICDNLKLLFELNIENCVRVSATAIDYAVYVKHIKVVQFS